MKTIFCSGAPESLMQTNALIPKASNLAIKKGEPKLQCHISFFVVYPQHNNLFAIKPTDISIHLKLKLTHLGVHSSNHYLYSDLWFSRHRVLGPVLTQKTRWCLLQRSQVRYKNRDFIGIQSWQGKAQQRNTGD